MGKIPKGYCADYHSTLSSIRRIGYPYLYHTSLHYANLSWNSMWASILSIWSTLTLSLGPIEETSYAIAHILIYMHALLSPSPSFLPPLWILNSSSFFASDTQTSLLASPLAFLLLCGVNYHFKGGFHPDGDFWAPVLFLGPGSGGWARDQKGLGWGTASEATAAIDSVWWCPGAA